MASFDPMEWSPPHPPAPSTPPHKQTISDLDSSPPHYKSKSIVVSSSNCSPEPGNQMDEDLNLNDLGGLLQKFINENKSKNNSNSASNPPLFHPKLPPLQLKRPRTYSFHQNMNNYTTLDHITSSPPTANPPITVLLALTPHPASLAEQAAFEALSARFCEDFSNAGEQWGCVNLYAHFREWAARYPEPEDRADGAASTFVPDAMDDTTAMLLPVGGDADVGIGIGSIHPVALRSKLEREEDVSWRFCVPVLQQLIEREVKKGVRSIVVAGLRTGDLAGVKAFGQKVAKPAGILAFLPAVPTSTAVPAEYECISAMIVSAPAAKTYDTMLGALYAKCISSVPIVPTVSGKAVVIDLTANISSSDDDDDDKDDCIV